MTTILKNSAFKVKVGSVDNTVGIVPERGAIIWDKQIGSLVAGDGFNWHPFGGEVTGGDNIALNVLNVENDLVAGTPLTPADFMTSEIYVRGTKIVDTLTPGAQQILFTDPAFYLSNVNYSMMVDAPQVDLLIETLINGVALGARTVYFNQQSKTLAYSSSAILDITGANDVLTVRFTASKNCKLTLINGEYGVSWYAVT